MRVDLTGRRVLITGASSGIGETTARLFAEAGAHVLIVSERADDLNAVAEAIGKTGAKANPLVADFSRPDQVDGLFARAETEHGPIDTLVNNAGIGLGAALMETRMDDVRLLFEINFFALASLCLQALNAMAKRGHGRILNVSSAAGIMGSPGVGAYAATKGAVHAFTQSLRIEGRAWGVHVTEVLPISVRTQFFDNVKGQKYKPGGVVLTSEAVAQSILRCAVSSRPKAEALPFRGIRAAFVLDSILPGLLDRITGKNYAEAVQKVREQQSRQD